MTLAEIMAATTRLPYFDLQTIAQLSEEPRHSLLVQLSRLSKKGKILQLRRGMYAMARPYRRIEPSPAMLANRIYTPSYLSFHWALGYYGMIPEGVVVYTSATTRPPRTFENEFGHFQYRHIKPAAFTAYQTVEIDGQRVLVADPEKALLDLWHIESGEWTVERMASMRFQGFEMVSLRKLLLRSEVFQSPRLVRAVGNWKAYAMEEKKGTREL